MTDMRHCSWFLAGLLGLTLVPRGAAAESIRAIYDVYAAGMTVLQMEADFEINQAGYRIETRMRTRGVAAAFISGEQVASATGSWGRGSALPSSYRSQGVWRGKDRLVVLGWSGGNPVVEALVPPNDEEREAVPVEVRRGTIDALSAMALLSRIVAGSGACEGQAPVYDGRRRSDFAISTYGRELIRPWRAAWHGEALRCSFEGRLVAGFMRDQPRDQAAAPQRGTAWIAAPFAGAPPIPVRIEMPSRWFGTATAVLLRAEASAVAQRRQ
ncbi:DUF3108 domain-containing protein [Roseomonas frigidaquae]|uniref:DUF3108 domain-containing protein n=1 Tax=Falsiroseomonas frigidaquae TaxID=487318 RepID=A0ABX1F330_9PROT|nr:DUF3108 domain-containing protein [Falsiroseomonas frigidaquae]NKE46733.1 DUF3108 domain-containing protein [Falsiroseomonas frigidaquae]